MLFHQDKVNWANFDKRKILYSPDANPIYLQGISPDNFFNIDYHDLSYKFNKQGNSQIKPIYNPKIHPFIVNLTHKLCQKAGISMLSVALYKTNKVGASTVAGSEIDITAGTLDSFSKRELSALIAHEIAHSYIREKQIPTMNEESAADIIGARLTSEKDMINLIKTFSKIDSGSGDKYHYSDKHRINEIKKYFRRYHNKKQKINNLEQKAKLIKNKNKKSKSEIQKIKIIQLLELELKKAKENNYNLNQNQK